MITLKQLEGFYWVAELGGLEEAARRLDTTQSAMSKRIQELEAILKVPLFDRSRRRVQISPQGERLLVLTREMLGLRDRMLDFSSALTAAPRNLRLGVTELTAMTWLSSLIQRIRGSHPMAILEPVVEASAHLMESLKADELDLVIVPDAFREPQFEIIPLDSVEYAWLCSPGYLGDPAPLPLQELGRYTIIVQRHASGLGDLVRRWLEDNGVAVENSLSSSSLTAIASMTLAGLGISYLPRRISDPLIASGQLRIIHSEPALPRMPYVVLYKKAKADDFMRFVASLATDTCDFSRTMPGFFPARLT